MGGMASIRRSALRSSTALCLAPITAPAPALRRVCQVSGDADYGCIDHRYPYDRWLGVRCLAGEGVFEVADAGRLIVGPDQALFVRQRDLRGFSTHTAPWQVWWYEFSLEPLPLPERQVLTLPGAASETTVGVACQRLLTGHDQSAHRLASAHFAGLLATWANALAAHAAPEGSRVDRVLAAMHAHSDGSLDLATMCRLAGVGERRLRQLMLAATGLPPGRCYTRIRAAMGAELVRNHALSIDAVATRFGFADRQVFTRACRRLLGSTPGMLRRIPMDPQVQAGTDPAT